MSKKDIRKFLIEWNTKFPLDKWWREKHKIAFLSPSHKEANFLYQLYEWEEENLFNEIRNQEEYIPNTGDFLKSQEEEKSQKELSPEEFAQAAKEELKNFQL